MSELELRNSRRNKINNLTFYMCATGVKNVDGIQPKNSAFVAGNVKRHETSSNATESDRLRRVDTLHANLRFRLFTRTVEFSI